MIKKLKGLTSVSRKPGIQVLLASGSKRNSCIYNFIKDLTNSHNSKGMYITLSLGHSRIIQDLKAKKIKVDNLFFIDCISKTESKEKHMCVKIDSPEFLTELSLAITHATEQDKYSFILFDGIDVLSVYNDDSTTDRFIHYIANKIRSLNLMGLLIVNGNKKSKLVDTLTNISDKVIKG